MGPGGNIKTAKNIPHRAFRDNLANIINEYHNTQHIIIHCMYSQKRGVQCCQWYRNALEELVNQYQDPNIKEPSYSKQFDSLKDVDLNEKVIVALKRQKFYLMKGGFNGILNKYINSHPQVFENFDSQYWKFESDIESNALFSTGKWVHRYDC